MYIDDSIVINYIKGEDISNEWIFYNLIHGEYKYEDPKVNNDKIMSANNLIKENLIDFSPYNEDFFDYAFPNWREVYENEMKFILTVGCPYPFEAMTRERNDDLYIIFDINRIYTGNESSIIETVDALITHEIFHLLYEKNDYSNVSNYKYEMLNMVFNEGFAHYLSLNNKLRDNYEKIRNKYYKNNLNKLSSALKENNRQKQLSNITEANANSFYEKYAPMVGLFILMDNEDRIREIYDAGYENILSYAIE